MDFEYKKKAVDLPPILVEEISTALKQAKTKDDIKAAFEIEIVQDKAVEEIEELMEFAKALNRVADATETKQAPTNINISTPQSFTVNEKDVTVTPEVKAAAPVIQVNVPDQLPPNVTVNNQVETPKVTVNNKVAAPKVVIMPNKKAKIIKDKNGKPVALEAE